MNQNRSSRRSFLNHITSLGVMGTIASLRSTPSLASLSGEPDRLASRTEGSIIRRGDRNFETWRQNMIWHVSKPDRSPDIIIQARSEQDVIEAVRYAQANKLKVSMRSSGHNSTGAALREGGVLLDLSLLREIKVNPATVSVTAQPGLWSVQLMQEAGKHGLAFPAAHCATVALGGYLLGGGMGWNHAHWGGIACHSVRGMDIVTANGHKVTASPTQNAELYWAARGAGPGFFGAVTKFDLALYPAPKTIFSSSYVHPLDNLATVTESLEKLLEIKDERVEILLLFLHNQQAPAGTPPEQAKICFVGVSAFADSEDEAKSMLQPFADSKLSEKSVFKQEQQPTTFHKMFYPENVDIGLGRYAVDNDWTNDFGSALHALAEHFKSTPSSRSHVLASLAIKPELQENACFSKIAEHYIASYLVWDDVEKDEENHAWLRQTNELLKPFSQGHYVNEVAGDRYPERYEHSFSKANWERLQVLRRKYDPEGVFHTYLGHH